MNSLRKWWRENVFYFWVGVWDLAGSVRNYASKQLLRDPQGRAFLLQETYRQNRVFKPQSKVVGRIDPYERIR